jgi:hypothetical protein
LNSKYSHLKYKRRATPGSSLHRMIPAVCLKTAFSGGSFAGGRR